ncbi:uncharacterized protein LOC119669125 [Teleopsis dalmanni]|uniref:uncharacterized protein LOC119669125 n=1 Tax=Teleopsis dalmanni TaxID=139649 RepID=UPI0018CFDF84|nr:uncharacterized protein LOC119669125 [Teleopsis dalmanni]
MQNEIPSLYDLNDDCLDYIFRKIVYLPDQLKISRVCTRFQNIYTRIWNANSNYRILELNEWRSIFPKIEDLQYFLHVMQFYFKEFVITEDCLSETLKDLEEWNITCLPSVERCDLSDFVDCYPNDCDIFNLTNLLPNLKYLRLTAPITGRFLTNFKYLEELHLYDEQEKELEISANYLKDICVELKQLRILDIRTFNASHLSLTHIEYCKNLEVLKLNLSVLKTIVCDVLKLPKLKTVTVLLDFIVNASSIQSPDTFSTKIYQTKEFYYILNTESERITGISIDNYFMPLKEDWDDNLDIFKHCKLEYFAFCNSSFESTALEKYTKMKNLKLLCLRNWSLLSKDVLLRFIELCPNLQHIDVSYCKNLDKSFLYDAVELLKQHKHRTINVYYLLSGLEDEIENVNINFWVQQKYIHLSADFPPDSERGLSYVDRGFQFDFD